MNAEVRQSLGQQIPYSTEQGNSCGSREKKLLALVRGRVSNLRSKGAAPNGVYAMLGPESRKSPTYAPAQFSRLGQEPGGLLSQLRELVQRVERSPEIP